LHLCVKFQDTEYAVYGVPAAADAPSGAAAAGLVVCADTPGAGTLSPADCAVGAAAGADKSE